HRTKGARALWLLWGFSKVTRRKGETNSRRYPQNGYVHKPTTQEPKTESGRKAADGGNPLPLFWHCRLAQARKAPVYGLF
ncbi:hypothetical protein, partial [Pseudomonas sp. GM60]|uniref:hypothetical protein n=1 Tax=Pseudomonas sp. GM60 TaxID=1144334 RepID=UPI001EE63A2D